MFDVGDGGGVGVVFVGDELFGGRAGVELRRWSSSSALAAMSGSATASSRSCGGVGGRDFGEAFGRRGGARSLSRSMSVAVRYASVIAGCGGIGCRDFDEAVGGRRVARDGCRLDATVARSGYGVVGGCGGVGGRDFGRPSVAAERHRCRRMSPVASSLDVVAMRRCRRSRLRRYRPSRLERRLRSPQRPRRLFDAHGRFSAIAAAPRR